MLKSMGTGGKNFLRSVTEFEIMRSNFFVELQHLLQGFKSIWTAGNKLPTFSEI